LQRAVKLSNTAQLLLHYLLLPDYCQHMQHPLIVNIPHIMLATLGPNPKPATQASKFFTIAAGLLCMGFSLYC
jgi:hypothetical protein